MTMSEGSTPRSSHSRPTPSARMFSSSGSAIAVLRGWRAGCCGLRLEARTRAAAPGGRACNAHRVTPRATGIQTLATRRRSLCTHPCSAGTGHRAPPHCWQARLTPAAPRRRSGRWPPRGSTARRAGSRSRPCRCDGCEAGARWRVGGPSHHATAWRGAVRRSDALHACRGRMGRAAAPRLVNRRQGPRAWQTAAGRNATAQDLRRNPTHGMCGAFHLAPVMVLNCDTFSFSLRDPRFCDACGLGASGGLQGESIAPDRSASPARPTMVTKAAVEGLER